jgi:hypothetical protein
MDGNQEFLAWITIPEAGIAEIPPPVADIGTI